MTDDEMAPACRQVWDRAVEGRDVMEDAALAAHAGSCMTCFRTLGELRDAPRLAAALRADAPAVPVSDRFWDDLAAKTTAASAVALADTKRRPVWRRVTGVAAIAVAAAAAWVLVAGRAPVVSPAAPGTAAVVVGGDEDEAAEETAVDVADLDESTLRKLLARLRAGAPANVGAVAAVGDTQESDSVFDDDGQMDDVLAELDGAALLRVARSLAGASL